MNIPAQEYGENLPYSTIFLGTQPGIPSDVLLSPQFRLDVTTASDDQIVDLISQLIAQYMAGLLFKQDQSAVTTPHPTTFFFASISCRCSRKPANRFRNTISACSLDGQFAEQS